MGHVVSWPATEDSTGETTLYEHQLNRLPLCWGEPTTIPYHRGGRPEGSAAEKRARIARGPSHDQSCHVAEPALQFEDVLRSLGKEEDRGEGTDRAGVAGKHRENRSDKCAAPLSRQVTISMHVYYLHGQHPGSVLNRHVDLTASGTPRTRAVRDSRGGVNSGRPSCRRPQPRILGKPVGTTADGAAGRNIDSALPCVPVVSHLFQPLRNVVLCPYFRLTPLAPPP